MSCLQPSVLAVEEKASASIWKSAALALQAATERAAGSPAGQEPGNKAGTVPRCHQAAGTKRPAGGLCGMAGGQGEQPRCSQPLSKALKSHLPNGDL